MKLFLKISLALVCIVCLTLYYLGYHPEDKTIESIHCSEDAPLLQSKQTLKVMSWNVQYMAGKNYVFFYDMPNNQGPDVIPSKKSITTTFQEVIRIIYDENPDILLIQEIETGSKRTHQQNQINVLLKSLPNQPYKCHASSYYWKSPFIPHPRIFGSIGLKLLTASKYKISNATRYSLRSLTSNILTDGFQLQRCLLDTTLPTNNNNEIHIMNTHFEAFAQNTTVLQEEVNQSISLLNKLDNHKKPWVFAGDLNMLPHINQYNQLPNHQQMDYDKNTQLQPIISKYSSVPSLLESSGPNMEQWFTHFPNDPRVKKIDRTIDYIFVSNAIIIGKHSVRQHDTSKISDHVPVITEIIIP